MIRLSFPTLFLFTGLLACPLSLLAGERMFTYVDEEGIEYFSNVPIDPRYVAIPGDRLAPAQIGLRNPKGIFALPYQQRPFHDSIERAGLDTGIDPALLHAVISVESGYNRAAVSRKGATGLMQLLPSTAQRFGTTNLLDPQQNIRAGAQYLRHLLALFDQNLELALAAYNAGEQAVIRHGRRLPPYAETQRYVPLVVAHYRKLRPQVY